MSILPHPPGTEDETGRNLTALAAQFPITTQNITNGTVALGDLATATIQNFLQLASAANVHVAFGSNSVAFTASQTSAVKTVTHGLGTTPTAVLLTANGTGGPTLVVMQAFSIGATTFQMQGSFVSGTGTATVTVGWLAIG